MNSLKNCTGISAIIVAHNSEAFLGYSMASLLRSFASFPGEVIVVDNDSRQNPQQLFAQQFPEVRWVLSAENLGFGTACNMGAAQARYSHLLFVNPDTLVPDQTIASLVELMADKPQAGLCGCKILNTDGTLQRAGRRSFPTPLTALARLLGIDNLLPNNKILGRYNMTYLEEEVESTVDAVSGSFFCVRKEVFDKVQGFDQDFFLYGEDLDLSFRVQSAGFENYYFPQVHVLHSKGHSSKNKPWFSYWHFYLAMVVFVAKHKKRIGLPLPLLQMGVVLFGCAGALLKVLPSKYKVLALVCSAGLSYILYQHDHLNLAQSWGLFGTSLAYLQMRQTPWAFNLWPLVLVLGFFLGAAPWLWVFVCIWVAELTAQTMAPVLRSSTRVAWYVASEKPSEWQIPHGIDINFLIRGPEELKHWKDSKLAQILQPDEIWITGPEYLAPNGPKIAQELGINQKEFMVITEPHGLISKLELNLLGTSLKLSKAI